MEKNEKSTTNYCNTEKRQKAGKTFGPPAFFFRFHRPCQSSLLLVWSGSGGNRNWMGCSWILGTFKGGLDSAKGEECVGGCLFVELSTWFWCPPRLSDYHFAFVSPSKTPPLHHARTKTPTAAQVCM